jgi:hypothetical protein
MELSASSKSLLVAILNMVLAVFLSWALLGNLSRLKHEKQFAQEKVEIVKEPVASTDSSDSSGSTESIESDDSMDSDDAMDSMESVATTTTTARADSTKRTIITPLPTELKAGKKGLVDFFDILLLMLISGALGGVLSNLRGIFVYYRDEGGLPPDYVVPYVVRPFTGGICGLFIYFVLSLMVTSITLVPVAEGVGFQGTVSYIAFAIVAGFGSQEFMERLKEIAITIFGIKRERSAVQKLRDWKRLKDLGLITEDQFNQQRDAAIAGASTPSDEYESFKAPVKPADKQGA